MSRTIFLNLPVKDLARSIPFYEALGMTVNPRFTGDTSACLEFSDTIRVMLLTHEKFGQFAHKPIADAHATTQALFCLSVDSRAAVDATAERVLATGRPEAEDPTDHGFMYARSFYDPDGHGFEVLFFDEAAAPEQMGEQAEPVPA